MNLLYTLSICVFLGHSFLAVGQNNKIRKADKKFNDLEYIDALKSYETLVSNGYENEDVLKKLGDAYYFNAQYTNAATNYERLFKLNKNQEDVYFFRYGQALKATKNYKKADTYLGSYYSKIGEPFMGSEKMIEASKTVNASYSIEKATFNTKYSDYPGYLFNDQLYVVTGNNEDLTNPWNGEPTSDIYTLSGQSLNTVGEEVNSKFNEGSLVISEDGNTMYFTRNNYQDGKAKFNTEKTILLKLYTATKIENEWTNIVELPFNSNEFSVGHPALDHKTNTLYFVSDMQEGGMGGTDIYKVSIIGANKYSEVTNVESLNTVGNEMFPYISQEGDFYYSSNGRQDNLGGLDIYKTTITDGDFSSITNMGAPINSSFDDFGIVVKNDDKGLSGYFATNRMGSLSDDIYTFKIVEEEKINEIVESVCDQLIAGVVRDRKTGEIISNAIVALINIDNEIVKRVVADDYGQYTFEKAGCDATVKFVRAEKENYQTNEVSLPGDVQKRKFLDILLDRRIIEYVNGNDLSQLLNPIYFDLDKSAIRPDAQIELQKIIAIMNQYPDMNIDVRSHTDSRSSDAYNMNLSSRRNRSSIDYIVNRGGISRSRLTGRGYGESQLVNGCANGVSCSEAQHQQNRRSEFIIK